MPFTEETLEFLVMNKLSDSREWFHAHHDEYERLVVEPLAELVCALTPAMAEIDPNIICVPKVGKTISRIWRDTRRRAGAAHIQGRDVADLPARKAAGAARLLVRVLAQGDALGLRLVSDQDPATMAAFRELILRDDPAWRAALRAYKKQDRFVLEDERYKAQPLPG